jgi:hypothetical protein
MLRKFISLLIAIVVVFSITVFADIGKTASATSAKASAVESVMPIQAAITVQSAAESRRCEPSLYPTSRFYNLRMRILKQPKQITSLKNQFIICRPNELQ